MGRQTASNSSLSLPCEFYQFMSHVKDIAPLFESKWVFKPGSYKTWTGFWTGFWNACELSFKLVEMQVEMLKTAVV